MGSIYQRLILGSSLCCISLCAEENEIAAGEVSIIEPQVLSAADNFQLQNFEDATDPYLEGYIQALIDVHYYEYQVVVIVKDHKVLLANLPHNDLLAKSIIAFVK